MVKKGLLVVMVLCIGLVLAGCPKKQQLTGAPSAQSAAELAAEKERAAKLEAERREKEAREAKIREEEARRKAAEEAQRKAAEEARKKAEAEAAAKRAAESLVAQKTPGVPGTIYETGLLKDVFFDFDRYDVRPGDAEILKQNAAVIAKNPSWKVQIEGHCDERGTVEYNLALGERRANSVKKYLVSLGIGNGQISTISYGEERPFDRGHDEGAWAKNRRAHFIVVSK